MPIPAPGVQLTSLSHVEDLADMMARVPGNWQAVGEHFNLCSDRCISFDGGWPALGSLAGMGLQSGGMNCCGSGVARQLALPTICSPACRRPARGNGGYMQVNVCPGSSNAGPAAACASQHQTDPSFHGLVHGGSVGSLCGIFPRQTGSLTITDLVASHCPAPQVFPITLCCLHRRHREGHCCRCRQGGQDCAL